jgi:subtilisin family serine protease
MTVLAASLAVPVLVSDGGPFRGGANDEDVPVAVAVLQALTEDGAADFWVDFEDRADLSEAKGIKDWGERGRYVYDHLTATAKASQADLLAKLKAQGVEAESFWITNAVLVHNGDRQALDTARDEAGVAAIRAEDTFRLPEPIKGPEQRDATIQAVEWGIANINADDVWDQFGARGEGVVVGNIDTGVDYTHPALVGQYRGNNGSGNFTHDYNWWDPSGVCADPAPCDNHGHGSHTMGTMVGDDGQGNQIGVAPKATWIAAKGCEATTPQGDCSGAALLSSGQFMLAPTDLNGDNPRPELRPHVVNNSWGLNNGAVVNDFYRDTVTAWTAAGIFAVFSNGNSGPGCETSSSPGDYAESYSVGAYDINNTIAAFSSRGASQGVTKPDISAPGVNVRSSVPGGYATAQGTSMAAPHVSGAVALLWSVNPGLARDIEATRTLLDGGAVDTPDDQCGGRQGNNNVYGEGRLDALASAELADDGTGTLSGRITEVDTGEPVDGATVSVDGPIDWETTTRPDGTYTMALVTGEYTVKVSKFGYGDATRSGVQVSEGQSTTEDFTLARTTNGTLSGTVTDGSGHGWPLHAQVTIRNSPVAPVWTDPATGEFSVDLPQGSYTLTVSTDYPGYQTREVDVTVGPSARLDVKVPVDDSTCVAPGYGWDGLTEDFVGWDGATPDHGWTVSGTDPGWRFDNPGDRPSPPHTVINPWPGTDYRRFRGFNSDSFAIADAGYAGTRRMRTTLTSPQVDLAGQTEPEIRFDSAYYPVGEHDTAEVELSVDGGATWTTVWHEDSSNALGPITIPIPQAAGEPDVRVRFVYTGRGIGYWAVGGDLLVGTRTCAPQDGGLLTGTVTDQATGKPLGAELSAAADPAPHRWPEGIALAGSDPAVSGASYWLFVPATGKQRITVTAPGYQPATATVEITASEVTRQDWALTKAGG